jgi:hypothetical protein
MSQSHEQSRDTVWPCREPSQPLGPTIAKMAPCGSRPWAIQLTAGDLHRAMDDLAAGVLHPCHSGLDGIVSSLEPRDCVSWEVATAAKTP